eukprot:Polyplicarium_translucidae@DN4526_c0_g1_i1.p1
MYGEAGSGIDVRAIVWANYDEASGNWVKLDGTPIGVPFTAFAEEANGTNAEHVTKSDSIAPFISAARIQNEILVMVADRAANGGNWVLKHGTIGTSTGFQATAHDLGPIGPAKLLVDDDGLL